MSNILGALGAVLVVLKLLGAIQLSWFWALAPFAIVFGWFTAAMGIVILALCVKGSK